MPERKFKVGDRVRLTDDNNGYGRKGAEGRIIHVSDSPWTDMPYEVEFDEEFHGDKRWWAYDNAGHTCNLELVATPTRDCYETRYSCGEYYVERVCLKETREAVAHFKRKTDAEAFAELKNAA